MLLSEALSRYAGGRRHGVIQGAWSDRRPPEGFGQSQIDDVKSPIAVLRQPVDVGCRPVGAGTGKRGSAGVTNPALDSLTV